MTLQVQNTPLPIIRLPNFSDVTWDQPMKNIPLNVGNEKGGPLRQISLYEYLSNFRTYLNNSSSWSGSNNSLIAPERDSHVIMTSQACFLPIEESGDTKFNVCLRNYQSSPNNPGVLVIVASSSGTSAQVVDSRNVQSLFFNKNGEKASFMAKRLKDHRKQQGKAVEGEMTGEEKADNMLLIIQVPLKVQRYSVPFAECMQMSSMAMPSGAMAMPMKRSRAKKETCDVDHAIISVGESEGKYDEIKNYSIERDPNYPVRVTLQYYKATSNGIISPEVVEEIAIQMVTARSFASKDEIGSLVTSNPNESKRVTEAKLTIAPWWKDFWRIHHPNFPHLSELEAQKIVFANSGTSFSHSSSVSQVQDKVLALLAGNQNQNQKPIWDPSMPFQ